MTTKILNQTLFEDFLGENIKVPYKDGNQIKVARGKLEEIDNGFIKIVGKLGTIIINSSNVEKMSKVNK